MEVYTVIRFGPDGITYSHLGTWDAALDAVASITEDSWAIVKGWSDSEGRIHPEGTLLQG